MVFVIIIIVVVVFGIILHIGREDLLWEYMIKKENEKEEKQRKKAEEAQINKEVEKLEREEVEYLKTHTWEEWEELLQKRLQTAYESDRITNEAAEKRHQEWKSKTPTGDYFQTSDGWHDNARCNQPYEVCAYCIHKFKRGSRGCALYNGSIWPK